MKRKLILSAVLISLTGCGTSKITLNESGQIVELKGEAANLYMATEIEKQRTETVKAMAALDEHTQLVMGARDAINQNDPVEDLYAHKSNRDREIRNGVLGASAIYGTLKLIEKVSGVGGDTYGDVNVHQSNDPGTGVAFGEGGGELSTSQSPNYVMIGRNKAASGNGAVDVEVYPNSQLFGDNKVLEAMACATPVVASPRAVSALRARSGREVLLGDSAGDKGCVCSAHQLALQIPV